MSGLPAPVFWIAQTQRDNNTSTVCIQTDRQTDTNRNTQIQRPYNSEMKGGMGALNEGQGHWKCCLVSRVCQPANGQPGHRLSLNGDPKPLATQTLQRVVMGDSVKPP